MPAAGQRIGGRQSGQAAADDDAVVLVVNAFEKILGIESTEDQTSGSSRAEPIN